MILTKLFPHVCRNRNYFNITNIISKITNITKKFQLFLAENMLNNYIHIIKKCIRLL